MFLQGLCIILRNLLEESIYQNSNTTKGVILLLADYKVDAYFLQNK
jgi:hypothetical protein